MPTQQQSVTRRYQLYWLPIFLLAWLVLWPVPARAAPAAQVGCESEMPVNNESQLNNAIACFNGASTPGQYTITLAADILLTASTTTINKPSANYSLLIDGATHSVDGQNKSGVRPFTIASNTLVTMQAIRTTGGNGTSGSGIENRGTLTITNSTISDNSAYFYGGGIDNRGTLTIINSTFSNNSAASGSGGGILNSGTLTITNSTFSNNSASSGGGIYNNNPGTAQLHNTIIANSTRGGNCVNNGGTINASHSLIEDDLACVNGTSTNNISDDPELGPLQDNGGPTLTHALLDGSPAINAGDNSLIPAQTLTDQRGAGFARIANGTVDIGAFEVGGECLPFPRTVGTQAELNNAILCYNTMDQPGEYGITLADDIPLDASITTINNTTPGVSLLIDGATHSVDGQNILNVRPFHIAPSTLVTIRAITVTGGNVVGVVDGSGGGIYNQGTLTITNSIFSYNTASGSGGSIYTPGTLIIHNSTFISNTSTNAAGGGIWNGGTLTITNSSFSHNTGSVYSGGIYNYWGTLTIANSTFSHNSTINNGGGIHNYLGQVTIANSTFSNNSATNNGGGIDNFGTLSIINSTFSHNSANIAGGGIYNRGTIQLYNTIIANSTNGDCVREDGTLNASHSLIEDGGGVSTVPILTT